CPFRLVLFLSVGKIRKFSGLKARHTPAFICPTRVKQLSDLGRTRIRPGSNTYPTWVEHVSDLGRTAV
ncbi:MAG: hypothetical protein LBS88_05530, partial [Tannerellaceae bacterium]|nr:hypothetical protein [Tannerellaceae bacterium]